jgi:hypothetical protein
MKAIIIRQSYPKYTEGTLLLFDQKGKKVFETNTLELPYKNNEPRKSCIPTGRYDITPRTSPKFGEHFLINEEFEERSMLLIHAGNDVSDTTGCILVGTRSDGGLLWSKKALAQLIELCPKGFTLNIVEL